MKKISSYKKAWAYLGMLFEVFDAGDFPHDTMLTHGICNELDTSIGEGWGDSGALSNILKARIEESTLRDMARMMDNTMDLQEFLIGLNGYKVKGEHNMLGLRGNDYQTRAIWCHLMAEVGTLPEFDEFDDRHTRPIYTAYPKDAPWDYDSSYDDDEDDDDGWNDVEG